MDTTNAIQGTQNPLITTAESLLLLVTHIREHTIHPDFNAAQQAIEDFETEATALNYPLSTVNDARFLLCALIDDAVLTSNQYENSAWTQHTLVSLFQKRNVEKRFFKVLERAKNEASTHLDLLELGYLCLSLGYQGIYKDEPDELIYIADQLYQEIRVLREDTLLKKIPYLSAGKTITPIGWTLPPVWLTALITAAVLLSIFIPYRKTLNHDTAPILHSIQSISKTPQ